MRLTCRCFTFAALCGLVAGCSPQHKQGPLVVADHQRPAMAAMLAPAPRPPMTTFGDGRYEVGSDIAPGKYKTVGPPDGKPIDDDKCYWARLKDFTDSMTSVTAMQYGNHGPDIIVIEPSDKGFETRACGTWVREQ